MEYREGFSFRLLTGCSGCMIFCMTSFHRHMLSIGQLRHNRILLLLLLLIIIIIIIIIIATLLATKIVELHIIKSTGTLLKQGLDKYG